MICFCKIQKVNTKEQKKKKKLATQRICEDFFIPKKGIFNHNLSHRPATGRSETVKDNMAIENLVDVRGVQARVPGLTGQAGGSGRCTLIPPPPDHLRQPGRKQATPAHLQLQLSSHKLRRRPLIAPGSIRGIGVKGKIFNP